MANSDVELEEVAISPSPLTSSNKELEEVAISVDPIKSLLDLVEEGRNRRSQLQPSISMVPRRYRDQNPRCFDPQVVSIGPLHKDHENVKNNDGLKKAFMHDLLERLMKLKQTPPQQTLERCFSKVNSRINEIKLCYGGLNNELDFDVAIMMVTDACFILEFIQKTFEENLVLCLGNTFTTTSIFMDLLLIENQIPFFVLQDIFDLTLRKIQKNHSVDGLLLLVHRLFIQKPINIELKIDNVINGNFKHILEIFHVSSKPDSLREYDPETVNELLHSVVELDRAGVKFKPNQSKTMEMVVEYESFGSLWTFLSFKKQPTFSMPVFTIHDYTELLLRNLIAFEQSCPGIYGHYFTSFAVAMDMLVDSKEDIAKLVESKIILNDLGSNEDAANMINSLGNDVTCSTFMYKPQFQQLDEYCKSYWPKHIARLKRTYFNSPWNAIAFIAGIILFALTAIQTIFTIMCA